MLIILAKQQDENAARLADRWRSHDAVLVTAVDLSKSGWSLHLASSTRSRMRIGDRQVVGEEIKGVLTLIPRIYSEDLDHIVPSDRQYVASEMSAFLLAWLSSLRCPVLNRPTAESLSGPDWRVETWIHLAGQLGIPVSTVHRRTPNRVSDLEEQPTCEITVIGGECFGKAVPQLIANTRLLAKTAGTDMLTAHFASNKQDSVFVSASPWPDLASPELADAALRHLEGRSLC